MRTLFSKLWIFFVLATIGIACERDGLETDKLYLQREFKVIENVEAATGYGKVTLTWDLPDSTSTLFYSVISWKNPAGEDTLIEIQRNVDSVVIDYLETFDYTFDIRSFNVDRSFSDIASLPLSITGWTQEPPAVVQNLKADVIENTLSVSFEHPKHRTYQDVVLEVYKDDALIESATLNREETPEHLFTLDYLTDYELRYYSNSITGLHSETTVDSFTTGKYIPVPPDIVNDKSRINYAYSADITWECPADVDSLRISFTDKNGNLRTYTFDATAEKAWMTLLPGGTTALTVQVSNLDGEWSASKIKAISTASPTDKIRFRSGNNGDNIGSCWAREVYYYLQRGSRDDYLTKVDTEYDLFTFKELGDLTGKNDWFYVRPLILNWLDEAELLVGCERILFTGTSTPKPSLEDHFLMIDRMPSLKTVYAKGRSAYGAEIHAYITANYPNISSLD